MTGISVQDVVDALAPKRETLASDPVCLTVGGFVVEVRCTSATLLAELLRYFQHVISAPADPDMTVHVLGEAELPFTVDYTDWAREPGKTGRKDAIADLEGGRTVLKVRTGVQFLQAPGWAIAFGPTEPHPNQVINFINTQILNHFQREGWVACHAAAVRTATKGLAISGLSGGGKSTTMLRLMEIAGTHYVTNDRLLVRNAGKRTDALGIPKLPRINPGTIVTNARLAGIIDEEREEELRNMEPDELWHLEEKYDLFIDDIYGPGRISHDTQLTDFWVLNWSRDSADPTAVTEVKLEDRPDLLSAILKSPGPFYQAPDGVFWTDHAEMNTQAYLNALKNVQVWEVTGHIDFDALFEAGADLLGQKP
ncbi:HprK-related kinase B [Roseibium sediminicola]|uniref:HprK-related kinase B n=1 Tax=Roseibium sediminicola TaxID=2933272 RepID=A0ABT0GU10_9HYPH|nr:HprK-related kinase B [Roseibium sp. CAU 1639]MCK7612918.1 HprK-related kinase B [Roseibium sp. CAU 1639]